IWRDSEVLKNLRNFEVYQGKCGVCEYRRVCGGCRARAFEATGDYLEEEPLCTYVPKAAC
ncbi:MAG: SPASM domain-containing protein, partial [Deltaproteobacteria bacterium]|nr:SPASM domain-containing protein [Deltaproteobacteria bacterium]